MLPQPKSWSGDSWQTQGLSIIMPTYQRPEGVRRALESLLAQTLSDRPVEIIIADNAPDGSAFPIINAIKEKARHTIHYIHVPQPGVSNARNGAMAAAQGRFILFLDDDMEAEPDFCETMIMACETLQSALVFGNVIARMPDETDARNPYLVPLFSRTRNEPNMGYMDETFGTGGCMLDVSLCALPEPVFDPALNETGGEDDALFMYLKNQGVRYGWVPNARAWEIVPADRITDRYVWKRNFAFGQGAIDHFDPRQPLWKRGIMILRHMVIGLVQMIIYAPLWFGLKQLGQARYIDYLAKTAQGAGKIFWSGKLSPRLYGQAALKS